MNNQTVTGPADASRHGWPGHRDAESVDETAHLAGVGRTIIYRAMHEDPEYRQGLPFLPSLKIGKRRLIRTEARRAWLRELEEQQRGGAR